QREVIVHVDVVLITDDDVDLPQLIATPVGHQSTTGVSLVGPEPDQAFALKKMVEFTSPEVLKTQRREEAPHIADLLLIPHFDAERSAFRKPAFIPPDIERVRVGPPV